MKDYSEIVEALRRCAGTDPCRECPYCLRLDCAEKLNLDAAQAIEELAHTTTKHGRLIDVDALLDQLFGSGSKWMAKVLSATKEELRTALTNLPIVINNAPTIIPAVEGDKEQTKRAAAIEELVKEVRK